MSQIINFTDPIGRKDYFKGMLLRWVILVILTLFISDFNVERFFEIGEGYQFQFLLTIIFLDLDIRRVKDIGISMDWLYFYYFFMLLPSPYNSTGSIPWKFYGFIQLYISIITIYLIFKKGIGIQTKLIDEYIVDPDNNKKIEEEARYRYENPSEYLNNPDNNLKVEEKPPYKYINSSQSKITQSISNFESESSQKINNNFDSTNLAYSRNEIFKIVKFFTSKQLKLDSSKLSIDSDFKNDLRADDIEIAEIIIDMENYFEIKISNEDADSFNTIGDVVIFIEKNI